MKIRTVSRRAIAIGVTALLAVGFAASSANAAASGWLTIGYFWSGYVNGVGFGTSISQYDRVQVYEVTPVAGSIGCRIIRSNDTISSYLWGATYAGWSSTSSNISAYEVSH